jgi:hypothetical protein
MTPSIPSLHVSRKVESLGAASYYRNGRDAMRSRLLGGAALMVGPMVRMPEKFDISPPLTV